MMILAAISQILINVVLCGCGTGDDPQARGEPSQLAVEIVAKLRAEAARLKTGHTSDLFARLSDSDNILSLKLSTAQVDLINQLDLVVRDVQMAWLTHGLDRAPLPRSVELSERLSEKGNRVRDILVRHAESIALEMVLEPKQANRFLRRIGRPSPRLSAGRYPKILIPSDDRPPTDLGGFDFRIRGQVRLLTKPSFAVSELFKIMLGQKEPAQGRPDALQLAKEQSELIRGLNEVARNVERDWLVRGLEGPKPVPKEQWGDPPPPRMVLRMSEEGTWLRESLVAHVEAIALEGILEPEQAVHVKRHLWSQSGLLTLSDPRMAGSSAIMSLLDPGVAASLRLTVSQREDLVARLEARAALAHKLNGAICAEKDDLLDARVGGEITEEQRVLMEEHLVSGARRQILEAEQAVWDVLTMSQIRAFRRIVNGSDTGKPDNLPAAKSKQTGRPG